MNTLDSLFNSHHVDLTIKVAGGIGAIIAFWVGYSHYKEGQRWQRSQMILSLMDSFKADPLIQAACLMLDWDQRKITLADGRSMEFRNDKLMSALRMVYMDASTKIPSDKANIAGSENADQNFSDEETLMRDCFDRFFDFFDKLHAFRTNELVRISDLRYFNYWFELVRVVGRYKGHEGIQKAIDDYIQAYHFRGFEELRKEYALRPEPLIAMSTSETQNSGSPT